jgi:hypothetical protein
MRQGPNKRGRGRGGNGPHNPNMGGGGNRRPNGGGIPNRNQNYDSNGPDVRIRGSAYQVYEKYMNLAQDAYTAGDRIMAESYYQHAEHYYRIIGAIENGPDGQRRRFEGQSQGSNGNGNYQYQQNMPGEGQPDPYEQGEMDERGEMQDGNESDQQRQGISHSSYGPGDHEQPE